MSDTTFNSESGGVADFMRAVADNARLMHTIQAQKVRIAELEHERDEARAELLRRNAIWLPEKDAEIERLRETCKDVQKLALATSRMATVGSEAHCEMLKDIAARLEAALAREEE